ncbi:MAG TPA: FtsX-like permease family protein, partial [Chthoniobacterales bacterium]
LTTHNNYESLMRVIDAALANRGHDVEVQLQRPAPATQLETVARAVPEVKIAEAFRQASVNLAGNHDGLAVREGRRVVLVGYPSGTQLLRLPLHGGRWPIATESDAVVINRQVTEGAGGLHIGETITVQFRQRSTEVRVVGIVEEIGSPIIYAGFPTFENITHLGDASTILRVKSDNGHNRLVGAALEKPLQDAGLTPGFVNTRSEFRASLEEHFAVVGGVMKMIALASGLVGAITLIATVSLGVIERGREIGVIRALGATPRAVIAIFLIEGGAVALLSAMIALPAGLFFARLLNGMAERQLLHVAVPLHVSRGGLGLLSGAVLLIILGVALSVRRILRLSVREVLAYQ